MNERLQDILMRSFDAALDEQEQVQLQQALLEPENRVERDRIAQLRSILNKTAASGFEPFFVQRLLQRLVSAHEEFRRWLLWGYRRVGLIGAIIVLLLALYNMSIRESVSLAAAFAQPEYTFEQVVRLQVPLK